nr:pentatricopeptide repeat protein AaPPR930 [Agave angustifolia]
MRDLGLEPDGFTLASLLSVCPQMGKIELDRFPHQYMAVSGVDVDLILGSALVDMYGKCRELCIAQMCLDKMPARNVVSSTCLVCAYAKYGPVDLARSWFDRMLERSIVSWNAMISCYVRHGFYQQGIDLYAHMQNLRVPPDEATLVNVLSACSQTGNLIAGKKTHDYICENLVDPSITLLNSIVDMYSKCGHVDIALVNFNKMKKKNVVSWNVIIGALAMHGRGPDAVELFRCMVGEGFSPDGITFVGLLSACSHGGLLEFGRHYFEAMRRVYKIPHELEHYACMVDLLGRGGQLDEAVELIRSMPMKPDVVIWGALLGACRIHGNVVIGKQVMKHVLELEPYSGGLYVLLSNLFCETQRWEDVKQIRKLMKERGIRKGKATSLIEINGDVYEFMVEDMSHENSSRIYSLLDALTDHLMFLGWRCNPSSTFWIKVE